MLQLSMSANEINDIQLNDFGKNQKIVYHEYCHFLLCMTESVTK